MKQKQQHRERCRILDNGQGGASIIPLEGERCAIRVKQRIMVSNWPITWEHREAEMIIDNITECRLQPGDVIDGTIVMIESHEPYDKDEPTLYLSWIDEDTVERIDGRVVWRWYSYVEADDVEDVLVYRPIHQDH